MKKNLWILTEERPKTEVLQSILSKFCLDKKIGFFANTLKILPVLECDGRFTFTYSVIGFDCTIIDKIFIKTVSGNSSFTDFLIFYQKDEPVIQDTPLYAIEETKTDDKESRNTGVYQRCSKFVFVEYFYPSIKKIMLYNLQVTQKETPTETNIFGTRLLLTLGVEILGKKLDPVVFRPFTSIDELIAVKSSMRKPPQGNVPINITKKDGKILISGRLIKSGSLAHDPNIGALSIIAKVLRFLGWAGIIEITHHGLSQSHITARNKFIKIASKINLSLEGLTVPPVDFSNTTYWRYDLEGEKLGTIFIHIVIESFTNGYSIFENHAGCERGYFFTKDGTPMAIEKYADKEKYKQGDKEQINHIPDLIIIDLDHLEVINIEGKKYKFMKQGIAELANYDAIEKNYMSIFYPEFSIIRTVVLYGGTSTKLIEIEVGFLLNQHGKLILGVKAPQIFTIAIMNLLDFWHIPI